METIKTSETNLPTVATNGHALDTTLQDVVMREEPSVASSVPPQEPKPHPWLDVLGKYEGEAWEEFRAQLKRNREREDREAAEE